MIIFKIIVGSFLFILETKGSIIHTFAPENYYFHDIHEFAWYEAAGFCEGMNMRLLSIDSDAEFESVKDYLSFYNSGQFFWTSGVDLIPNSTAGGDGSIWTTTGKAIEAQYWGVNEPGDSGRFEMCVSFTNFIELGTYMLVDQYCADKCGVICKKLNSDACQIPTSEPCPDCPYTEMPTTCAAEGCPICPSPSTCPIPETTTDAGSVEFICEADGQFPDPLNCHVFHVCISYNGTFIDDEFDCPENLVYCPLEEICDYNISCPCNKE